MFGYCQLTLRPVISSLSSNVRFLPLKRSYIKKTHKLDHFNEFGKVLSKEAQKSKTNDSNRLKVRPKSRESSLRLDHFNEFGPVISQNDISKKSSTVMEVSNVPEIEGSEAREEYDIMQESELESSPSINNINFEDENKKVRISPLLNSSRASSSSTFPEAPSILRIAHESNKSLPSVTRILSATMSEESKAVLARWEKEKIGLLGEEGFRQYKAEMFSRGKFLHTMLETFLEFRTLPQVTDIEDEVSKRHRVSISQMIENVGTPLAIESSVCHTDLGYSGIVDCVAIINNTLTLIDWKTSEKVKNNVRALYDNPLQLAAYIGAVNRDERYSSLGNITSGAVVVVYNSGYPAMTHTFSQEQLGHYWKLWCLRLHQYKMMT